MSDPENELLPADLQSIAERLRGDRYEASPLELDRIKRRAMAQASSRPAGNRHEGMFMRSKLLSTALAVGVLLSTASVGLGVTGNFPGQGSGGESASASRDRSASSAQYGGTRVCRELRQENRRDERDLVRRNRADERTLRARNRAEERGLRGRARREAIRRNRAEERVQRRRNRGQERSQRNRNRAEERRCTRTGSP